MSRGRLAGVVVAGLLASASPARSSGGDYVFIGGSEPARETVRAALGASSFDWDRVPHTITIRIAGCGCAGAKPGEILLDEQVLTSTSFGARYAWGIVQHEYAHQVAYLMLDRRDRRRVIRLLGGSDWCYEVAGLPHDEHACERFAATFAWAFWPSRRNISRAHALLPARQFRREVAALLAPRPSPALRGSLSDS